MQLASSCRAKSRCKTRRIYKYPFVNFDETRQFVVAVQALERHSRSDPSVNAVDYKGGRVAIEIGKIKLKTIEKKGRVFLHRLSWTTKTGSIKVHLILNDDVGDPHIHPWTFTSFLAIGAYKELINGKVVRHAPFSLVRYDESKRHKVILYRLLGFKLPCLTIGRYSAKVQRWCEHTSLCDVCKAHGECLDAKYWRDIAKKAS